MADVIWFTFPEVRWSGRDTIELVGEPQEYRARPVRHKIARDLLSITSRQEAVQFVERWGPTRARRRASATELANAAFWLRQCRAGAFSADEERRAAAEFFIQGEVSKVQLRFAPGSALVPELLPRTLIELAAIALLEEMRSVGPVLQCLNWPSPGCLRDVPPRKGERGRRPLYCSQRCAERARSQRSYARRRARKEAQA